MLIHNDNGTFRSSNRFPIMVEKLFLRWFIHRGIGINTTLISSYVELVLYDNGLKLSHLDKVTSLKVERSSYMSPREWRDVLSKCVALREVEVESDSFQFHWLPEDIATDSLQTPTTEPKRS